MPQRRIEEVFRGHPLVFLPKTASVRDAAKLMTEKHVAAIVVMDHPDTAADGIFTERDLVERVVAPGLSPEGTPLSKVMTADPVTVSVDHTVLQAMAEMRDNELRHLPITKHGRIIGLISVRDFIGDEVAELDHERAVAKGIWEHMR